LPGSLGACQPATHYMHDLKFSGCH
jgi:hypothetical protein